MRLAFICTEKLPVPAIRGGALQVLIDGVAPIISAEHELTVFSITDPELPVREKSAGITYNRFPKKDYTRSIADYLKKNKPFDVIHVFNRPANIPSLKAASPSSRFVLSVHNEMFAPQRLSEEQSVQCNADVDKIITVSDYIAKTVVRRCPAAAEKLSTIYSGADPVRYVPIWSTNEARSLLRSKYGLKKKKVILFVGRLNPQKGPHILIGAFRLIEARHPRAVLMIVGGRRFSDDSADAYTRKLHLLSEPVRERVIFSGHVAPKDIPDYFMASDIFVSPSQWQEPLARVQYEAMAAGLPVITSARGGNAEVIIHGHNGIVVEDYKDPAAFARGLDTILSRPYLAGRLGRQGRKLVKKKYNFGRVARDLLEIYTGALANSLSGAIK